jgi:hypothetical protein
MEFIEFFHPIYGIIAEIDLNNNIFRTIGTLFGIFCSAYGIYYGKSIKDIKKEKAKKKIMEKIYLLISDNEKINAMKIFSIFNLVLKKELRKNKILLSEIIEFISIKINSHLIIPQMRKNEINNICKKILLINNFIHYRFSSIIDSTGWRKQKTLENIFIYMLNYDRIRYEDYSFGKTIKDIVEMYSGSKRINDEEIDTLFMDFFCELEKNKLLGPDKLLRLTNNAEANEKLSSTIFENITLDAEDCYTKKRKNVYFNFLIMILLMIILFIILLLNSIITNKFPVIIWSILISAIIIIAYDLKNNSKV